MPRSKWLLAFLLMLFWVASGGFLTSPSSPFIFLSPVNDNCSNAMPIPISGGGYDYGIFNSQVSDMSMASKEPGEFFEFGNEYLHTKSVWFEFTLATSRRITIKLETAPGSTLPDPKQSGVTLYAPSSCLPGAGDRLGSIISSGDLERFCTTAGTYRIQVTAVDLITASFVVSLTVSCPHDPIYPAVSIYDCPDMAYEFNAGMPLPQSSSQYSQPHMIECHSIENPSEYACLPLANRNEYTKSAWYVFTTGDPVDFLAFDFSVGDPGDRVGYRMLEGNVRNQVYSSLPIIDCGLAEENSSVRYIEFPCLLKANTTYSLDLLFHQDFVFDNLNVRALQRGMTETGWPKPVLPPVVASNQLGVLPMVTNWSDRFDCNSFIRNNVCPPANPASGLVTINSVNGSKSYDLSTWATFTLATDGNVSFKFDFSHTDAEYFTRIYQKTLTANCPSPDPASSDLYFEFAGKSGEIKCLPEGDYSIQVLAGSNDNFNPATFYKDSWSHGYLGTKFRLAITVEALPSIGLFRLDAPNNFEAINNLNPLVNNVLYPGTPAVFICDNTVLPQQQICQNRDKAIYREFNIGDFDADGMMDEGLICIRDLLTDYNPNPPITYEFYRGDANQLATSANTFNAGEFIPGLTDFLGFCIDQNDNTLIPPGIDKFCACVTAGTYTLTSFGNEANVGHGDAPKFTLITTKTIHDSPANAEIIAVGAVPGSYVSSPDVFSCTDNLGTMPPCGNNKKLVFREFYLADTAVVTIRDIGQASPLMSLYKGRAIDLLSSPEAVLTCFISFVFYNPCTPLEPGWYTIISYGYGPNFTDKVASNIGWQGDVGKSTVINILLEEPVKPRYNRPEKAYQAGITDWMDTPANSPNAATAKLYSFGVETFCDPDTPFIANQISPCAPIYNRVAFYVFEITKPSFVQIRNVNATFYTEVFPFDVNAQPGELLTTQPVYPCLSTGQDTRQICDLPPGKYTIALFANDSHYGQSVQPALYVDEAGVSRFDHVWNAYDFDFIPLTDVFVDGKPFDTHPTLPGQSPSRDVFYCTTGAHPNDPTDTKCGIEIDPLVYAQPIGVPKPLYLPNIPPDPVRQPWRNLWYTFKLSGSGICTVHLDALNGTNYAPFVAVYESDADGNVPWAILQTSLNNIGDTIIPGLKLIREKVDINCDAEPGNIVFTKSGCIRDNVRYYVLVTFDAYEINGFPPNLPNQAISVSIKYNAKPTYGAPYDEVPTANVINGLIETTPPYTPLSLSPGSTFVSPDFSLLCYTQNITDPVGCIPSSSGKSAWFKFDVSAYGQLLLALEKIGVANGWVTSSNDISVWRDTGSGVPFTDQFLLHQYTSGHDWLSACIDPGTYYLLVRQCTSLFDTIQPYHIVLSLQNSPGDFCSTAIPIDVNDFNPTAGSAIVNCHTIGTDIGEILPVGNPCFSILKQKTSWFKVRVNTGPMIDLKFQVGENFTSTAVDLGDVHYRILSGTCGAMTPIACSEGNINLTLNCLGLGDYYVQVSMPEKTNPAGNSQDVEGTVSLTVTATPSNPQTCMDPFDPNEITANFTFESDCQSFSFYNLSTAGSDITYLWVFPDGTSTDANPVWFPPGGASTFQVTLIVTNNVLNSTSTITQMISVNDVFTNYVSMSDQVLCNGNEGFLDATYTGAIYLWDDNSTQPVREVNQAGLYWVLISLDGCTLIDTVMVDVVDATKMISQTLCADQSLTIHGQVFDLHHPNGTVTIANADPSGCDSVLTVQLSFLQSIEQQVSQTICHGENFLFGNQLLTQPGIYQDTMIALNGCDSIVTLNLAVTPLQTYNRAFSDCIGNAVLLMPLVTGVAYAWNTGATTDTILVHAPGTYVVSVTDLTDCIISEETFTVTFGVLASPNVSMPAPACAGTDVLISANGSSGQYFWFDSAIGGQLLGSGSSIAMHDVQADFTIYLQAYVVGLDTCWSERVPVPILVIEKNVEFVATDTLICVGDFLTLPWGEIVQPTGTESFSFVWPSIISGCDSLQLTVKVGLLDLQSVMLPSLITLHLGDSVQLEPVFDFLSGSMSWMPPDGLSCTTCLNPWAKPAHTMDYLFSVWSIEGCLVTAPVRIEVDRNVRLYVPNVFSPNGDGFNDVFTAYGNREVALINRLAVYDRWGELLWESKDFPADGSRGWDGLFHNKPMSSGVYAWTCEVELIDGSMEVLHGDLTLVR